MPYNPFLGFCLRVPPPIKFPQAVPSLMISGEGRSHNYETHEIEKRINHCRLVSKVDPLFHAKGVDFSRIDAFPVWRD